MSRGVCNAISAAALIAAFCPSLSHAYTSDGSAGMFQPSMSVALDPAQAVFNFTDILISRGVDVTFSGMLSGQPIRLLATGNVDIAGTLDAGGNDLWIETPGNISINGLLRSSGGTLSLMAGNFVSLSQSGGIITVGGRIALRGGVGRVIDPSISSGGAVLSGGSLVLAGGSSRDVVLISDTLTLLQPVPEPGVPAMLAAGLIVLLVASRRSRRSMNR